MPDKPLGKINAIIIIFLSGVVSWALATFGVELDKMEMGALLNIFGPPIIGLGSIIVFLFIDWLTPQMRLTLMGIMIIVNLATGILIRLSN